MATLKQLANHTGLDEDRIEEILNSVDLQIEKLTIDAARIEIIKALRAGASGNVQKEEVETEAARLAQARRIKIEVQTKQIRTRLKPKSSMVSGLIIDDTDTAEYARANATRDSQIERLRALLVKPIEPEKEPERAPPVAPQEQRTIILI